jgi:cell division topological specificity factor
MKRLGFPLWPRKAASAQTAKERLQILLAHERSGAASADCLPQLQRDILEVIGRHMQIDRDAIDIRMQRGRDYSSLEINIEFPAAGPSGKAATFRAHR